LIHSNLEPTHTKKEREPHTTAANDKFMSRRTQGKLVAFAVVYHVTKIIKFTNVNKNQFGPMRAFYCVFALFFGLVCAQLVTVKCQGRSFLLRWESVCEFHGGRRLNAQLMR
jgi:hypothetical protein